MRWLPFCLLLVAATAAADAQRQRAKTLYQQATSHYAIGDFVHAADEYEEAYTLKPDPALLYNAAQARRMSGANEKALVLYRNYVSLYPNEQSVAAAREQIDKLKEAIAAAEKAKNQPPAEQPKTAEPKSQIQSAKPAPPETAAQAQAPAAEHKTPVYKKWWLWTIVGVVVAGGVVTAAVLATRPGNWANEPTVGPGAAAALVRW
jgi:tetratricopeptide (TPR) repeat protein